MSAAQAICDALADALQPPAVDVEGGGHAVVWRAEVGDEDSLVLGLDLYDEDGGQVDVALPVVFMHPSTEVGDETRRSLKRDDPLAALGHLLGVVRTAAGA